MIASSNRIWFTTTALAAAIFVGCTGSSPDPTTAKTTPTAAHGHGHSHDGWWCSEHGVPEEECALCNSKLAAEFQKKGDWCEEHNRPDSQCFICHPELAAKFAARYEAKYGKQPPQPVE